MRILRTLTIVAIVATALQSCKGTPYAAGSASSGGYTISVGAGTPPPTTVDYGATEAALNENINRLTRAIVDADDPELMDKLLLAMDYLIDQKEAIADQIDGSGDGGEG
jgi:hypothetical protein